MRVLVVEDDKKTAEFISKALLSEGHLVDWLTTGEAALEALEGTSYEGLVLDVMLPGCDGISVLKELRKKGKKLPVLLPSARGEVNERVEGLDAGADDYLPKPFVLEELTARVRALARRAGEARPLTLTVGDLTLDTTTRIAHRGARKIELTTREFRLLEFLMRCSGQICSRMFILEKVWDYNFDPGTNIVEVYVRKLREKICQQGEPQLLQSVRGVGYVMRESA